MALQFQLRRGTTAETKSFTGAVGEVTVDTTKDVVVVHDGVTIGGFPVAARANADGTISLIKKDGTSAGEINASGLFNNTLTSTNTNQAATAAQAKILNDSKLDKSAITITGNPPVYGCRAWVNFNGATGAIRNQGNVMSVVRNGVGNYTINFIVSMPDDNYAPQTTMSHIGAGAGFGIVSQTNTSITLQATYGGDNTIGVFDPSICSLSVFC